MIREEKNIIALCGRQSSGKTMLATYLVENMGYKRIYLAQALKELCSKVLGMSIDEMNSKKNVAETYVINDDYAQIISQDTGIPIEFVTNELNSINYTFTSIRHMLQFVGTDLIRKYNPNWHVESMLKLIKPNEKYVVDDVRFPNEVQAMQYHGATLIFIIRPIVSNVNHHASEESIKWQDFDNLIINNGTETDAITQLLNIINNNSNSYAENYLKKYDNNSPISGKNYLVKVTKNEDPAELTVYDKSIGWIVGVFNAKDHPLIIEDLKFKMY